MSFLIDTDIVSSHLRIGGVVTQRFLQYTGRLHVSTITLAELKTWLYRSNTPQRFRQGLEDLLSEVQILTVDESVADEFGMVGALLLDQQIQVATPDLLIAATALVHDLTVVTHNVTDFAKVPGLRIVDWLSP